MQNGTEKSQENGKAKHEESTLSKKRETNWPKVLFQIQITISSLCAFHYLIYDAYWSTILFTLFLIVLGHIGVAAGAHRLWAHNAYTADGILKYFLLFCQTISGTGSLYDWVRWHRLHHKYFGTDLDPYNPSRGWFYAHIKSITLNLSPAQEKALEEIDMSDLEKEKIIMFQKRWYPWLYVIFVVLLPINAPAEYWGENLYTSSFLAGWLRGTISLHLAWLIHSATLIWGLKPGEKYPCDTNLVFILNKTHWLSYHYLAPWDYQTSEYGQYGTDFISKFIRVCAALEVASDLKVVASDVARKALTKSVVEKKSVTESLLEITNDNNNITDNNNQLPKDHYLNPSKFY